MTDRKEFIVYQPSIFHPLLTSSYLFIAVHSCLGEISGEAYVFCSSRAISSPFSLMSQHGLCSISSIIKELLISPSLPQPHLFSCRMTSISECAANYVWTKARMCFICGGSIKIKHKGCFFCATGCVCAQGFLAEIPRKIVTIIFPN